MFKKIALVIAVLVVAVLAFAATRPDFLHVERAGTIKAPPEKIGNDFQTGLANLKAIAEREGGTR